MFRLIRPHSFHLPLQNQYSQPAERVGTEPMRDAERPDAFPPSIYSLIRVTSRRYRKEKSQRIETADRDCTLWDVEPRHALAHGAEKIRRHGSHAPCHQIRRQPLAAGGAVNRRYIADGCVSDI